jgi:hypothetical protein
VVVVVVVAAITVAATVTTTATAKRLPALLHLALPLRVRLHRARRPPLKRRPPVLTTWMTISRSKIDF